jgi:DNA-binding NtrC family response regulator
LAIKKDVDPDDEYIGGSLAILKMFERIRSYNGNADRPVLLMGPSGVGKSVLAELIARHGRPGNKYLEKSADDVMAADESIALSLWKGYGKNSLVSNARQDGSPGFLETCDGGTIFFDELHSCPKGFQTFLLGVVDKREMHLAHGEGPPFTPDVRLIFATSHTEGEIRSSGDVQRDLYRRLNNWIVEVPSLRNRKEDIPLFVAKARGEKKSTPGFLLALLKYDWPGEVRELVEVLDQAVELAGTDNKLEIEHLRLNRSNILDGVRNTDPIDMEYELYRILREMLEKQGWVKGKGLYLRLADILSKSEPTVSRYMNDHFPQ